MTEGVDILSGDSIKIAVSVDALTGFDTALPAPHIVAAGELAEADKVAAAVSFPVKLAATLVKKIILGENLGIKTCTSTHLVEIVLTVALNAVELTLGKHEECVGKTEERPVGIVECVEAHAAGSVLVVILVGVDILDTHIS